MGQACSWFRNTFSKFYPWKEDGQDGETGKTSIKNGSNLKRIAQLFRAGFQYFLTKEHEISHCLEQGLDTTNNLVKLEVTQWVKGLSPPLETKCPLSLNNIVFSSCDHNGGVIASEDGIKLIIPKNAIKEGLHHVHLV